MAITPLLCAVLAARRQRWVAYAIWMTVAVSFKEDIALAAAMFGVVLMVRGHRRAGAVTIGAALGWLAFVSMVLIRVQPRRRLLRAVLRRLRRHSH
jgi:hypothetical protein